MRTFVVAALAVVVVALVGGCAGSSESDGSGDRPDAGSRTDSAPTEPESPAPSSPPEDGAVVDSEACEQVRSGIDAFNRGEFDETVERFEEALPLAQSQDDGSERASQLVEAVRYYAELDADQYLEAARSSPDFARYKAITLGQCALGDGEAPESPGLEV